MHLCKTSYKRSGDSSTVSNVDLFLSLNADDELMLLSGKKINPGFVW
jgi:hypothetical protein